MPFPQSATPRQVAALNWLTVGSMSPSHVLGTKGKKGNSNMLVPTLRNTATATGQILVPTCQYAAAPAGIRRAGPAAPSPK